MDTTSSRSQIFSSLESDKGYPTNIALQAQSSEVKITGKERHPSNPELGDQCGNRKSPNALREKCRNSPSSGIHIF